MEVHFRLRCCLCQVTGFPDLEDAAHGLYVRVHYPGFVFVPEADVFGHDETRQYPELENNVPALIKNLNNSHKRGRCPVSTPWVTLRTALR